MKHTKRFCLALFLLCALLCALCSCGKSAGSYRASDDGYAENGSGNFGTAQEEDAGASAPQAAADRKLIRTFTLRFETKDYDTFLSSMRAALQQNGGYSEKAEQSTGHSLRYASYTLRVPAENADAFLTNVRPLATLRHEEEEQKDVTLQYVDNESRLGVLRTERESLERLLAQADSMENILQIRDRLTEINEEIESYTAQLRTMDNQIDYVTIYLSVSEVERITAVENESAFAKIGRQFSENLSDIGKGLRAFFIWFVSAVPYFVLIGILGCGIFFAVFGIVRAGKRRRAKRRAAAPGQIAEK